MARREILFLAHRIPFPPDKGDKIRSFRIFEFLRAHFDVHLAAFVDDPRDMAHRHVLAEKTASLTLIPINRAVRTPKSLTGLLTGKPLSVAYYHSWAMATAISALRDRPLAGEMAFSSTVAQFLRPMRPGRPRMIDLCDADSVKWRDYAQRKAGPMSLVYQREARRLERVEREIIRTFDLSFAISPAEAALLAHDASRPVDWFGNGVDTEYFDPSRFAGAQQDRAQTFDVIFTGAMDYWANIDACLWFLKDIWPRIRAEHGAARFGIVGSRPARELMAFDGRDGVHVTGRVPDIRPYLVNAGVAIAPMRIARGVQNKMLEAMAAGRPVVATLSAATGIEIESGRHYVQADAPEAFAGAVLDLIKDRPRAATLGNAARQQMISAYQWPTQLARLEAGLTRVGCLP